MGVTTCFSAEWLVTNEVLDPSRPRIGYCGFVYRSSLLYLIGADPEDLVEVWGILQHQFQRNTWANKLSLRRRLHSFHLRDGNSVQDHIKAMTELFNNLQ